MRAFLLCLVILVCAPATAGAALAPPLSFPASTGEVPRALAFGSNGHGAVVTQSGGPPYSRAAQAVITLPAGRRTVFADTAVLDSVSRQDGGVDLLVRRGSDITEPGDLILRRVLPSGRVLDLWSVRTAATDGALARGRDRTVVTWPQGSTLKVMSRPDRGIPSRPRTASLALRGYTDLDLAIDGRGRLVAAVTSPRIGLVLASLTARGTVLRRQVVAGASGHVEMVVTAGGRVGVLIEDTGIEGDGGECVADREGRHIRVVVREQRASRFGSLQTIESPPFGCGSSGALLRATPADGLTVLYQGGSYDRPPLLARAATASRGEPFGTPLTLASDARADTAVVASSGELVTALLRKTDQPEVFAGALSILSSSGQEEPVAGGPAFAPLLAVDRAGATALVWRTADALHVAG